MPIKDVLPEIALILGAVTIVLAASFLPHRKHSWCAILALLTLAIAAGLGLDQWSAADQITFKQNWALDHAAILAKILILFATAVTVVLSPEWLSSDKRHGEYYALVLFAALGAIIIASAHDGMELLMGVLLSSAASYPLVAFHRNWPLSGEAGMKYFLMGALANAVLVVGVVLLFGAVGDTAYHAFAATLVSEDYSLIVTAVLVCVISGLAFKLAAFPFYAWMPDVAQGAPAPVAAMLSVVPKIGAAVALARFVALLPPEIGWRPALAFVAAATMTLGNLGALWQADVRRLLGWSSISQSGYALMAVTVVGAAPFALPALLLFLGAYTTANLALFAAITNLRGRTALDDFNGLGATRPLIGAIVVLGMLSLVGIPPLIGFFGKLTLFETTISGGYTWLAVVAVANTVLSLYYYLRVVQAMYFRPAAGDPLTLGPWSSVALWGVGPAVVVLGIGVDALEAAFSEATFVFVQR